MIPIAVFNEKTTSSARQRKRQYRQESGSEFDLPDNAGQEEEEDVDPSLMRDLLLAKQQELQRRHFQQSQELLGQHQGERERLDELEREGSIPRNDAAQLSAEMEVKEK